MVTKTEVASFYDRVSPHFLELWGPHLHDGLYARGDEPKEAAQDALVRHLARLAAIPRGARVLDVGSGLGGTSIQLARELGCTTHGITISPVQVELGRRLAAGLPCTFELADADAYVPPEPFDVLWMVGVLGHLPDQRAFVARSPRLLRPGGRFVLGDWMLGDDVTPEEKRRLVDPVLAGMRQPHAHPRADYERWFAEAGYDVVATEDLTAATLPTWDAGVAIVKARSLLRLAFSLGSDLVSFVRAIRGMRTAMHARKIVYGVVIAERKLSG